MRPADAAGFRAAWEVVTDRHRLRDETAGLVLQP
jgi:hypothetical protein